MKIFSLSLFENNLKFNLKFNIDNIIGYLLIEYVVGFLAIYIWVNIIYIQISRFNTTNEFLIIYMNSYYDSSFVDKHINEFFLIMIYYTI